MKMLLSTTALAFVLGTPTLVLSQAPAPAVDQTRTQQATTVPGFLATRGQSDLFASDLIGHDVYARRTPGDMTRSDGQANVRAGGTRDMATMNRADLNTMDNIGQINEIVLSNDGQVRALVIGVGGFLGMGERDVAVTMDQVTFTSDADDRSRMYIVVKTGADVLKGSPAFDRKSMTTDGAARNAEARADRPRTDVATSSVATSAERLRFAAPAITREGYGRVEAKEVSAKVLIGKSVYGVDDSNVGTVTDMIIDDGAVTSVVIDFGGFLGMGKSQISIDFDELTIMSTPGYADVRVYVDATKEQIQARPRHQASK